ncbi:hypothetical protein ABPG74_015901 [Tetrahymena malaccensis]
MKYKKSQKKAQKLQQASPQIIKDISKKGDLGRPKKLNKQLRDDELRIKQISMNWSYQEEILIRKFGGYEFQEKLQTKNIATNLIQKLFGESYKQEFENMLIDREQVLKECSDPIEKDVTPLSAEYFLQKCTSQGQTLDLKLYLTIFLFQIFLKTDEKGFQNIFNYFKEIFYQAQINNSQQKTIIQFIHPGSIFNLIKPQDNFEEFKIFYKYMYEEMLRLFCEYKLQLVIQ